MDAGSGVEGRIYAHYKSLRKSWDYRNSGRSEMYLYMARVWRMPCWEIERIIKEGKKGSS